MNPEDDLQATPGNSKQLEGWTKEEKFDLLQCLKEHGSLNIVAMLSVFPKKSAEQIKEAIDYYKAKAFDPPNLKRNCYKVKSEVSYRSSVPLYNWAKLLTDSLPFEDLQTDIPTALRLIAQFEDIPPPLCTEGINFKKVYLLLANAMEGKALIEDEKHMQILLNKCVLDTALGTRSFIRLSALNQFLDNVDASERGVNYNRLVPQVDMEVILKLAMQKNYNPLNIPVQHLKPSET